MRTAVRCCAHPTDNLTCGRNCYFGVLVVVETSFITVATGTHRTRPISYLLLGGVRRIRNSHSTPLQHNNQHVNRLQLQAVVFLILELVYTFIAVPGRCVLLPLSTRYHDYSRLGFLPLTR